MIRRHFTIRPLLTVLIVLVATTPMLVQAGLLDSWLGKGKTELPEKARYDREPDLVFGAGPLAVDIMGNWTVGNCALTFTEDSVIDRGKQTLGSQDLCMGQEARMMGYRLPDGTIAVSHLTLTTTKQKISQLNTLEPLVVTVEKMPANAPK